MVRAAYSLLQPVLRTSMTADILKSAKVDVDGTMYLEDFLGDNDFNLFNKSIVSIAIYTDAAWPCYSVWLVGCFVFNGSLRQYFSPY